MSEPGPESVWPCWRVDAKWIVGLALVVLVAGVLMVAALWRLSSPDHAIDLTATAVAASVSPNGLDDPTGISTLETELRASGSRSIDPLGLGLTEITTTDLAERSPRELRLMIFRPLAERLYHDDPAVVAADLEIADEEAFREQASVFGVLNRDTNRTLGVALIVGLAVVGGLGWLLVRFSSRAGRIVSPSLVAVAASSPGLLLTLVAGGIASGGAGEQDGGGRIGTLIGETVPIVTSALLPVFGIAWIAGFAGLVTAAIVTYRSRHHRQTRHP